jgi:predicted metalloprotease with PDZ domain
MFNFFSILLIVAPLIHYTAPVVHYTVIVDAADTTSYTVEMRIGHAPSHFGLAMATHPEYDDRFWRFVRDFKVTVPVGKAGVIRKDSALYDIDIPGDKAIVRYRIRLPPVHSYAHRPFLGSYGGLVGDLHSFFYLVGHTQLPATVHFQLPPGWEIATSLEPITDASTFPPDDSAQNATFRAVSAETLMDCPVLIGRLKKWQFRVDTIPYTIAYLPVPGSPAFDTTLLVENIKKIVQQAVHLFGATPFERYTFLLEDGVYGALEHASSVTIGLPAAGLASDMQGSYEEIAHEFFHAWNLISIHPEEYNGLTYGPAQRSAGLWFSEGLSMFYADLLVRRAGLPCEDSSRIAHLAALIGRYYTDTGNRVFSPAAVSLASTDDPRALGDYSASTHLQGELLGAMLDILIRNCSDGRSSIDDVMRWMYQRYGGKKGFKAQDVEQAVDALCTNPEVHVFFDTYLYQGKPIDFEPWLRRMGLTLELRWAPATETNGTAPAPDHRLYCWQLPGDTGWRLMVTDPRSCWGRAGLHTGDIVLSIDAQAITIRPSFYAHLNKLGIGDTVSFLIRHSNNITRTVRVGITGYTRVIARIPPTANTDDKLFRQWASGW